MSEKVRISRSYLAIDKVMNKILDETFEHFKDQGVTREQVSEIYFIFFYNLRQMMKSPKFPVINVPKFGIFKPKISKIRSKAHASSVPEDKRKMYFEVSKRLEREFKQRKRKNNE